MTTRYLNGPAVDQILAEETIDDGETVDVLHMFTDHQGSVRDITDNTVAIVDHILYDSYGNAEETSPSVQHTNGFAGYMCDPVTGLYITVYRFYDPVTGRWMQQDLVPDDSNPYRYARNSTTNFIDPNGRTPMSTADLQALPGPFPDHPRAQREFSEAEYKAAREIARAWYAAQQALRAAQWAIPELEGRIACLEEQQRTNNRRSTAGNLASAARFRKAKGTGSAPASTSGALQAAYSARGFDSLGYTGWTRSETTMYGKGLAQVAEIVGFWEGPVQGLQATGDEMWFVAIGQLAIGALRGVAGLATRGILSRAEVAAAEAAALEAGEGGCGEGRGSVAAEEAACRLGLAGKIEIAGRRGYPQTSAKAPPVSDVFG